MLCYDADKRGAKLVRAIVPTSAYDVYFKLIAEAAIAYIDKYRKPPGEHTLDIVEQLQTKRPKDAEILEEHYQSIEETWRRRINRDFILSRAELFARQQRLRAAMNEASAVLGDDEVDEETVNKTEAILAKARKVNATGFDPGIFLHDTARSLRFLETEDTDQFLTGIKVLDQLRIGPARRRLFMFQAPYGTGKTWCCCGIGRAGLQNRLKVCHVTLEDSEQEVIKRYVMTLFALTEREADIVEFGKFKRDELGRFADFKIKTLRRRAGFDTRGIARKIERKIALFAKSHPKLLIKGFPSRHLTIDGLEAYLDALEGAAGFIPDELIIDYPDEMAYDPKFERQELSQIYSRIRAIATTRNLAAVVPTQSNRAAEGDKAMRGRHTSKTYDKNAIADTIVMYQQTEPEQALGFARLHVDKARGRKGKFNVLISQAYGIGQFCMDSVLMTDSVYWGALNGRAEE